jgi:hypothetical protein
MELKKRTWKGHLGISFLFFPLNNPQLAEWKSLKETAEVVGGWLDAQTPAVCLSNTNSYLQASGSTSSSIPIRPLTGRRDQTKMISITILTYSKKITTRSK